MTLLLLQKCHQHHCHHLAIFVMFVIIVVVVFVMTISNQDKGAVQPTLAFKVWAIGQQPMHEMETGCTRGLARTGSSKMIMNTTMMMMIKIEEEIKKMKEGIL